MVRELFYQGRYKQILAATIDSLDGACDLDDVPFVVGALTFRGRLHEAEHFYELHAARLGCEGQVVCRFFLGVNLCRHSQYARARRYLGQNLRSSGRQGGGALGRFYAWQGLGFYRLFCGRHRDGFRAAQRALAAALEANFLYGKALASDLMAHNQVLPGQVSAALGSFRDAIRYAELLGDGGLLQAFRVSLAVHSAQYGLNPERDVGELQHLFAALADEDNYSQSRLLLEIGRQLTLRGDLDGAEAALNNACQLIYGSDNRRYGIQLNLRYAYLMYLRGEPHQALNLVRNAAKELDLEVDRALQVEVTGLEQRILRALGQTDAAAQLTPRLTVLSRQTGRTVAARILARDGKAGDVELSRIGDDPLGDLLDLARLGDLDAAVRLVERGFYGLLLHLVPDALGTRTLYFDLIPGGVVILDRGRVRYGSAGFSSVIRAIVTVLAQGEASKQDLIESVWGYKYQPLKHDAVIYRNVSRFRALLGPAAGWLEVTESGYRFADGVQVRLRERVAQPPLPTPAITTDPGSAAPPMLESVNYRQLKLLEHLAVTDYVDVKTCATLLGTPEITARRDLAHLHKLALVQRVGKGRATRYRGVSRS